MVDPGCIVGESERMWRLIKKKERKKEKEVESWDRNLVMVWHHSFVPVLVLSWFLYSPSQCLH